MNGFYVAGVIFAVLLLAVVAGLWARVRLLERDLANEARRRQEFWNEWHGEKWYVRGALDAAGLERTEPIPAQWRKTDR